MIRMFALLLPLFLATPAFSAEPKQPPRLFDFVEAEMLVGMQTFEGTAQLVLHIYSEEEYQLAREIAETPRPQHGLQATLLADKIPSVKSRFERYIATLPAVDASDKRNHSILVIPIPRVSFGRIAAIGDDYLLVELDGNPKRRRIIPSHSIGRLELDAEAVHFARPF
jgi:hypothetical protein